MKMSKYAIKDYWCYGCGLVYNSSFVCPVCGSISYGIITFDLTKDPNRDLLVSLYIKGSLYVHRENGKLALRDRSIGNVTGITTAK